MENESVFIHLEKKIIELQFRALDDVINVDELLSIDYSNLYGEAITISTLLNKIGLLKAEAEKTHSEKKLDRDIYEANLKKKWRREAAENGGRFKLGEEEIKLTEGSLGEAVLLDPAFQILSKNVFKAKSDLDKIDSMFWAVKDKSQKLNNLLPQIIPSEFENEIAEGVINAFMLKKHNKKYV